MLGKEGNICVNSNVSSFAEHLVSRYGISYACITIVLDSNSPIIQFKSMTINSFLVLQLYFNCNYSI